MISLFSQEFDSYLQKGRSSLEKKTNKHATWAATLGSCFYVIDKNHKPICNIPPLPTFFFLSTVKYELSAFLMLLEGHQHSHIYTALLHKCHLATIEPPKPLSPLFDSFWLISFPLSK